MYNELAGPGYASGFECFLSCEGRQQFDIIYGSAKEYVQFDIPLLEQWQQGTRIHSIA